MMFDGAEIHKRKLMLLNAVSVELGTALTGKQGVYLDRNRSIGGS